MFQRQLSQSALGSLSSSRISGQSKAGQRALFQRQMTASQLLASSGQNLPLSNAASQQNLTAHSAQSGSKQRGAGGVPTTKNKRIISRMLSISAIHTGPSLLSSQNDSLANSESASCQPGALPANGGSSIIQQAATLSAAELQQGEIEALSLSLSLSLLVLSTMRDFTVAHRLSMASFRPSALRVCLASPTSLATLAGIEKNTTLVPHRCKFNLANRYNAHSWSSLSLRLPTCQVGEPNLNLFPS